MWHHWGRTPEPHLGGTAVAFWGAPGVLGEAPARAVAGWRPRGTVGVGKRRREPAGPVGCRHRGCRGARAATPPAQHVAQLKVTVPRATRRGDRAQCPRHSHTLCHWPLFSGCPKRVSGTERFRWHRRIPVAPVVRKGEPALSSPGRCPAGAAVTHGPGGCGRRLARPTWSQHGLRLWDEEEKLNSQISALVGGDPRCAVPRDFWGWGMLAPLGIDDLAVRVTPLGATLHPYLGALCTP